MIKKNILLNDHLNQLILRILMDTNKLQFSH